MRASALIVVAGFLVAAAPSDEQHEASPPAPEEIRAAVETVLAQGVYRLEDEKRLEIGLGWLFDLILDPIRDFLDRLGRHLENAPPIVRWLIIGALVGLLLFLLGHILYSLRGAMRGAPTAPMADLEAPVPKATDLAAQAGALAESGNFVDATRLLCKAALYLLEEKRGGRVRAGLTINEYVQTFQTAWVVANLRVFAGLITWKWYGNGQFDESDYRRCREAFETIESKLEETVS